MAATLSTQSLVAAWEQFLTDYYKVRIEEAALNYPEIRSVEVDYNDLDRRDPQLAQYLLDHPRASLQSAEDALKLVEVPVDPRPLLRVRVRNLPRVNRYMVRKLRAEHLGKFVAVEGLVKKVVEVRPKLRDATFQCQRCGAVFNVAQEDQLLVEPKSCDEGQGGCGRDGPFKLLAEESRFIDSQKIEIQESHEDLRGGAQAERISVYLEEDLTGRLYPGDSIVINGIFRAQQRRQGSYKLAEFIKVLDCVSFEVQQLEFEEIEIKPEDVPEILKIAGSENVLRTIKDSFAPEIYGMDDVKEALIMSLFGGVAKEFKDGTRIRGDIHCLLVGDPGVAKCLRGDSIIPLATGERPTIASLVDEAMRGETHAVDDGHWAPLRVPVYSMDPRGRIGIRWSSKAWKRTAPAEMIRVLTRSGRSVEVTPTHPLFMTDGLVIHPREAGKLEVGQHVAVPRRIPATPRKADLGAVPHVPSRSPNAVRLVRPDGADPEFWHFCGLVLGDGNVTYKPSEGKWWLELTNATPELNAAFEHQARRMGLHPGAREKAGSPAWHSWASGVEPSSFLTSLGLNGTAAEKGIPPLLFKAGLAEQIAFLSGLLDADGHYSRSRSLVQLVTASRRLALGVQDLLLNLGVMSSVREKRARGYDQSYWAVLVMGEPAARLCGMLRPRHPGKLEAAKRIAASSTSPNSNVDVVPVYSRFFKDMRLGLGLDQASCGVPRSTWLGLERGEKQPTRSTFAAITEQFVEAAVSSPQVEAGYVGAARKMATLGASDLFWDEIVSIERVAPSEPFVYDLEVPQTHNFLANGIVNHNSQILRYTSKLSPRSVYTSGKGSSAAGLTATAVRDEFGEGQWSLEAGALVLADKGVVLVDEMDKMEEYDQSAMHQAMEQQEISISKAGINATLKSRCAVIGAANPKTGRFDDYSPIVQQINMPPPLLSRFDLIFSMRDKPNKETDEKIARHILGTHRAGEVHEARKRNPDGPYTEEQERQLMKRVTPAIEEKLLRRYVAYAKRNFFPVLTDEAADRINSFYQTLRNQATGTIGITPRQIEALIRLTEASARVRLSNIATIEDAERAVRIFGVFLRTVGWNEEAGTFDIDIIAAGASSSQQQRMRQILEIIRRLTAESGGEGAKEEDIKKEAAALSQPIPAEKVGEALTILKERGSIFMPRHGRFQPL